MSRKARLFVPGITYHSMARGLDGTSIFNDDEDRKEFLSKLNDGIHRLDYRCYAWSLLSNHYHLLIRSSEHALRELFQPLHSQYAFYYNTKYHRRGYLFQDRFKSIATQDQSYIERLVRYVHLNPIRSGICKGLNELRTFPWSGHAALMGFQNCPFQDTETVLRRFGPNIESARMNYCAYLMEGLTDDNPNEAVFPAQKGNKAPKRKNEPGCWAIGDREFIGKVIKADEENRLRIARYQREGLDFKDLVKKISEKMNIDQTLIIFCCRKGRIADARKVVCYFGYKELGFSSQEIAAYLKISPSAVTIAAQKGMAIAKENAIYI